jgi:hypothetical protein
MLRGIFAIAAVTAVQPGLFAEEPDYSRDIKPLLRTKCFACHGAVRQKAGLRLDAGQLLLQGSKRGEVVIPGKPNLSTLVAMVSAHDGVRADMPPEGEGEALTPKEIALVRAWIAAGAKAPKEPVPPDPKLHWAYQPPRKVAIFGEDNPVDQLLEHERKKHGLGTNTEADRATLLRRVYLDLIGLPPTPAELHAFLEDRSPHPYEVAVDRLLASPQYGERWGRHWMDIWRYSDPFGNGEEYRYSQRHIWHWRDWIVESLNADKGYDRMVVEMLAGDEIAPGDRDTLRATGYLARNWYKFNRNIWVQDTTEYTAAGFLGMTLRCCRCHDHKYDPISQEDYYRFRSFFEPHDVRIDPIPGQPDINKDGVPRAFDKTLNAPTYLFVRGDERNPDTARALTPAVPRVFRTDVSAVPITFGAKEYARLFPEVAAEARRAAVAARTSAESAARHAEEDLLTAKRRVEALAFADKPRIAAERFAKEATQDAARARAQAETAGAIGDAVEARARADEARLGEAADDAKRNSLARDAAKAEGRAELFKMAEAPTPTRVAEIAARAVLLEHSTVKEYTSLIRIDPLGSSGRRLALAQWITDAKNPLTARVAVNHIWMRHFGTPLVSTVANFGLNGKPPTHPELLDWLAAEFVESHWSMKHLHRLIVTSRAYRLSSRNADGPNKSADPENRFYWRANARRMDAEVVRDSILALAGQLDTTLGGPIIDEKEGLTSKRRSLYFRFNSEYKMTFLDQFDAASPTECYERRESVIPQQALALHNSSLALNASREVARQLGKQTSFVIAAYERVLGRQPSADEQKRCEQFLIEQAALYGRPGKLTPFPSGSTVTPPSVDPLQRAREDLVHVLLNHNDFVTIR